MFFRASSLQKLKSFYYTVQFIDFQIFDFGFQGSLHLEGPKSHIIQKVPGLYVGSRPSHRVSHLGYGVSIKVAALNFHCICDMCYMKRTVDKNCIFLWRSPPSRLLTVHSSQRTPMASFWRLYC